MKSADLFGAWGCHNCHSKVDTADRDDFATRLDFAKAVFRTQAILIKEGIIQW